MKDIFGSLNDLSRLRMESDMQNELLQSQVRVSEMERASINNKYSSMFFNPLHKELEDMTINIGSDLNKTLGSKQGFTKELLGEVWNSKGHIVNKYIKDCTSFQDQIRIVEHKIKSCQNMASADKLYDDFVKNYKTFIQQKKVETIEITQELVSKFEQLAHVPEIIPNQVNPLQINPNIPNPQALEEALKRIEELTNTLAQKEATIQSKDVTIGELREKNMTLQGRLLDKTEEVQIEHNKYIEEKHKVDLAKVKLEHFIGDHDGIEGIDNLTEILGDLQHEHI